MLFVKFLVIISLTVLSNSLRCCDELFTLCTNFYMVVNFVRVFACSYTL